MNATKSFLLGALKFLCLAPLLLRAESPSMLIERIDDTEPEFRVLWTAQPGVRYELQKSGDLIDWLTVPGFPILATQLTQQHQFIAGASHEFFRVRVLDEQPPAPSGMALIPAGPFEMGDSFNEGGTGERPVHTAYVSGLYMDRTPVTKALWDEVYQWAIANGYGFANPGSGKGANHPVNSVNWYDVVKWCNARSEKEGRVPAYYTSGAQTTVYRTGHVNVQSDWVKWNSGYRLPTEAEWEKAARGGASGQRFPWGNTITHSQANYSSSSIYSYDVSPTRGDHPTFNDGVFPYTSPVGYFEPNGYGLYDMAGNVWEWCWDWWDSTYYSSSPDTDPRGPTSGWDRVIRGGGWFSLATNCRAANRSRDHPSYRDYSIGFRSVLPPGQP